MTAPSPALIPIDPEALAAFFVALAQHGVPSDTQSVLLSGSLQWRVKPHAAKAAIRAYLAASGLLAVVEAFPQTLRALETQYRLNNPEWDGLAHEISTIGRARAALAAIKGGNDAG